MFSLRRIRRRIARSTLLRLALVVSVWQGPLPYRHAHAAAVDVPEAAPSLVEHLRLWHAGAADCTCRCLDAHWHFEYPHAPDDGEPPTRPSKNRLATPAAAGAGVVSADCTAPVASPLERIPHHDDRPTEAPGDNTAVHFFDGFAPTLAPPLRFCVARC